MNSLKFGTSGLRGLVVDLDTPAAFAWVRAFCDYLVRSEQSGSRSVMIGRDLRQSSPSIARRVAAAIKASGFHAVDCGALPTPALALAAMSCGGAAVMITGSHIPDDRNGLKFYSPRGEIGKADEDGVRAAFDALDDRDRGCDGQASESGLAIAAEAATNSYAARYIEFFGETALRGLSIGLYEHSSVARDILKAILSALGASVTSFARSERFVPVDTEAYRPQDVALIASWAAKHRFDAIVSTDGDADRPLVADTNGTILRGDILGLIVARHLSLNTIVTPVTSSSAIEQTGIAERVLRTKVGSPYVIAAIDQAKAEGLGRIVGFEANGGVLLGSNCHRDGHDLAMLVTRDAILPILCALLEARADTAGLSGVVASLKAGITAADRLKDVSEDVSASFLKRLEQDAFYRSKTLAPIGTIEQFDTLDGVRMLLSGAITVHYRASGNAPELRCYVEASTTAEAKTCLEHGLAIALRETSRMR